MKESITMTAETMLALAIWRALDEERREQMLALMREMIADQERERADDTKGDTE